MRVTRAVDYAVRVMLHMASFPPGTIFPLRKLAQAIDVSDSFLAKIMQSLTRGGLVASRRGPEGGYELSLTGREATILKIMEVVDGPLQINDCVGPGHHCAREENCAAHSVWTETQAVMTRLLARDTIGSLATKTAEPKLVGVGE